MGCEFLGVISDELKQEATPFSAMPRHEEDEETLINPVWTGESPEESQILQDTKEEVRGLIKGHVGRKTAAIACEALIDGDVESSRKKFRQSQSSVYRAITCTRYALRDVDPGMCSLRTTQKRMSSSPRVSVGCITSEFPSV